MRVSREQIVDNSSAKGETELPVWGAAARITRFGNPGIDIVIGVLEISLPGHDRVGGPPKSEVQRARVTRI